MVVRRVYTRNILLKYINDGDTFLNIGSHIGTFVVYTNKLKKLNHTICVEASSANVSQLLVNIKLNQINNAKVFHLAAGNLDQFVEFSMQSLNLCYYNARALDLHCLNKQKNTKQGSEFVQMKKIDNLFKENMLLMPNFMLMDIDGHENLALEGMEKLFKNKKLKYAIIETTKYTDKFVIGFMKNGIYFIFRPKQ